MVVQFSIQLVVVSQAGFAGQLLFFTSFLVSVAYEWFVACQMPFAWDQLIFEDLLKAPSITRHVFGTRAAAAAFMMRVLSPPDVERHLAAIIPSDSDVWRLWRQSVAQMVKDVRPVTPKAHVEPGPEFSEVDRSLLTALLADAEVGLQA